MKVAIKKVKINYILIALICTMIIVAFCSLLPKSKADIISPATSFAGGSGTESSPYQISNASELLFFANNVNRGNTYNGKYLELTADIDLNGIENWNPIGCISGYNNANNTGFKGVFNGNNYSIENCNIIINNSNLKNSNYSIGFFGAIQAATIKNLIINNINISISETEFTNTTLNNDFSVGALSGKIIGKCVVTDCSINNFTFFDYGKIQSLSAQNHLYSVGGITGDLISTIRNATPTDRPTIKNNIVKNANINTTLNDSTISRMQQYFVGGLIGRIRLHDVTPINCVFSGTVKGNAFISPTIAANRLEGVSQTDYNTISGLYMNEIDSLFYFNAICTKSDGTAISDYFNKRVDEQNNNNPFGSDVTTNLQTAINTLNSNVTQNNLTWKTANSEILFDYGDIYVSIERSNSSIQDEIILTGSLLNYEGQEVTYSWTINGSVIDNTTSTLNIKLKTYIQEVKFKAITLTGEYEDTIQLEVIENQTIEISGTRTGVEYTLTAQLFEALETQNLEYKWTRNGNLIENANLAQYIISANSEEQVVELIVTDILVQIEYIATYTVPRVSVSIQDNGKQGLMENVSAKILIEETEINSQLTNVEYIWTIGDIINTESVPNKSIVLTMQEQIISLSVIIADNTINSSNTIMLNPLDLHLEFSKDIVNTMVNANISGNDVSSINLTDFTYQWYNVTNDENAVLIEGANTLNLSGYLNEYKYKLIATNSVYSQIILEGIFIPEGNVLYVDYNNGINTNDGTTPQTALKTLEQAYTKLSLIPGIQYTSELENIIVLIGTYADEVNEFGNGINDVFKVPATITGKYKGTNYSSVLYFFGGEKTNILTQKKLNANTKFEYLTFRGKNINNNNENYAYIYAQGNSLTMGKGINMSNYIVYSSTNHGFSTVTKAVSFHIVGGHLDYNGEGFTNTTDNPCVLTIESGQYARIIGGSRNTVINNNSKNVYGKKNQPFNVIININYTGEQRNTCPNTDSSGHILFDIGVVCGGQTDGAGYFNSTINWNNGTVGRFVGGSLGNERAIVINSVQYETNFFEGIVNVNISGGYINELYGGSLGRTTGEIYFRGNINLKITGGIINSNIYLAGAAAITGSAQNISTVQLDIEGGTINGNVYGGAYGYSSDITTEKSNVNSGRLYGNIFINIKDGIINGSIYGGGKGSDGYATDNTKQALAKVIGNIEINIENDTKINGSVYGAGEGYLEYPEMAEVTGNVRLKVKNQANLSNNACIISGNIFGAGNNSKLIGTTYIEMKSARIFGNLYGGGKIAQITNSVQIELLGSVYLNSLYGGGENGVVGLAQNNSTQININIQPTTYIYGNLFGAGNGTNAITYSDVILNINGLNLTGNLYGAGDNGIVYGDVSANIANINAQDIYGGGNNADVSGSIDISVISGTITNDIYGGGNLGKVTGNTNLLIGDVSSEKTIIVNGLAYAGGKGADSTTIMVSGNSQANIVGMNTHISAYGSIELGAVAGEVNIIFNNYKNRNYNNRYKNMSGINKATNLQIINSYVYLTGGIQAVTNMQLPSGSGIMISEDSQIAGNFSGGGVLYLQSEVCFTINGNIIANSGTTTLTLNPAFFEEENIYKIKGSETYPYVVVKGTDNLQNTENSAFLSGYLLKYSILNKSRITENDVIYYIYQDVEISTFVGGNICVSSGKEYSLPTVVSDQDINGASDIELMQNGSITSEATVQYTYLGKLEQATNEQKFKNIRRSFSIKENYSDIVIPIGTRITIIYEEGMCGYNVTEQNKTSIPISDFKYLGTKNSVTEKTNVAELFSGDNLDGTVRYIENIKVIMDFSDCESKILEGTYNFSITILDGNNEINVFDSSNTFHIDEISYNYTYSINKDVYFPNDKIVVDGDFVVNDNVVQTLNLEDISGILKLQNSNNQNVAIPEGSVIRINNVEYKVNSNVALIKMLENISNNNELKIELDMQNAYNNLEKLSAGTYYINLDFYISKNNIIKSNIIYNKKIPFEIINSQGYGIKATINNQLNNDKKQLVEEANEQREIRIDVNKGNLIGSYIDIKLQKRNGPFSYETITNSVTNTVIENLNNSQTITAIFARNMQNGMYRLVFELYDENTNKYTEDTINFLVQR